MGATFDPGTGTVLALLPGGDAIVSVGAFDGVHAMDRMRVTRMEAARDSKGNIVGTTEVAVGLVRIIQVLADHSRATAAEGKLTLTGGERVHVIEAGK
jgi:hypothetical protein